MPNFYSYCCLGLFYPASQLYLTQNQENFWKKLEWLTDPEIYQIIKGVWAKNLRTTQQFIDFSKAFNSYGGKMMQILQTYGLPKEIVTAIMKLYKNTKAMVHSPDGVTEFFDIVARVFQGDRYS